MTKIGFAEHIARKALDEMKREGLEKFSAAVVMDLKRVAEGDWPLMCDEEQQSSE